jgi:hypothetical protein
MEMQAWRAVGASVVGTSHIKTNTPCQDHHRLEIHEGLEQVVMMIASDGAGSASRSEHGSNRACQELQDSVQLFLDEGGRLADITRDLAQAWLENVAEALGSLAQTEGFPLREYACTLLAAFISPSHAVMFQVGDGAIVFWPRGDEGWCLMTWPQHGEYINTTVFVTDPAARANFEFCARPDFIDEIAVFTDGIEALVLHFATQSVHGAFFDSMFPALRHRPEGGISSDLAAGLATYLASETICDRTDDDKTLLLASRVKRSGPLAPAPTES